MANQIFKWAALCMASAALYVYLTKPTVGRYVNVPIERGVVVLDSATGRIWPLDESKWTNPPR